MLLKIAFRNIIRHKRRTFFSAITIAVGIIFFIIMDSIMAGMDRGAIDNMIAFKTGALRIQTKQYSAEKDAFPLKYGVENYDEIRSFLSLYKKIKGVTYRTPFLGILSNYSGNKTIIGTVIEPATDSTVFNLPKYIEGSYFTEENEREILIGKKLAEELGVSIG
ncbi:MAG: ABC transporter permease, partial [Chitinispirillaceae bacterium]|nr:ABC transporter permease [Chitinispirillaceae bacterium]